MKFKISLIANERCINISKKLLIFLSKWHHDADMVKGAQMVKVKRCIRGEGQPFGSLDAELHS